ncbi:MAG: choice-of-anchor Q domain-containing protein [Bacteroidota bacterium]
MRTFVLLAALMGLATAPTATAATIQVTTLDTEQNTDGDCSLREAMLAAQLDQSFDACAAGSGADTIEITVPGTIRLDVGFRFTTDVTLRGVSSEATVLTGSVTGHLLEVQGATVRFERLAVDGSTGSPITDGGFLLFGGAEVTFEDVVIRDVASPGNGGAIRASDAASVTLLRSRLLSNRSGDDGGGLYAINSNVTLRDSEIRDNEATGQGGGLYFTNPGFSLTVERSAVVGNEADAGGGLYLNSGTADVRVSTLADNEATGSGGGLIVNAATVDLHSVTVTGNVADADADGTGDGGGIQAFSGITLASSVVAENEDRGGDRAPDIAAGGTWTTQGFNAIGDGRGAGSSFPAGTPNANGDRVGTEAAPLAVGLGALGDNGGPTPTRLPMAGSLLIDGGDCGSSTTDQRGAARPVDGDASGGAACDIGAVEAGATVGTSSEGGPLANAALVRFAGPNPTRGPLAVEAVVSAPLRVSLVDALGREVWVLHDGPVQAGQRVAADAGRLAPGVYALVAQAEGRAQVRRLTLVP